MYWFRPVVSLASSLYRVFRSTLTNIPQTQSLLNKAKLPLGLLLHPFKDLSVRCCPLSPNPQ